MEEEEDHGKIPRFIRHRTPLRCANCRFTSTDLSETEPAVEGNDSGNAGSIRAGGMVVEEKREKNGLNGIELLSGKNNKRRRI